MDNRMLTTPQVARVLGVSLPAAHHALDLVGVPRTGRGHPRYVPEGVVARVLASRGATPKSTYPPAELRVLAVLSRSPIGLRSARAVATRAGVSPTTAARVLRDLTAKQFVVEREQMIASGKSRRARRILANTSAWPELLRADVRRTQLPEVPDLPSALPQDLHDLFWNADVSKLTAIGDGSYVAGRLLEAPDIRAWRWALTNLSRADIETALSRRGVKPRTKALAQNWWSHAS